MIGTIWLLLSEYILMLSTIVTSKNCQLQSYWDPLLQNNVLLPKGEDNIRLKIDVSEKVIMSIDAILS